MGTIRLVFDEVQATGNRERAAKPPDNREHPPGIIRWSITRDTR